jgi:hypothetical protein
MWKDAALFSATQSGANPNERIVQQPSWPGEILDKSIPECELLNVTIGEAMTLIGRKTGFPFGIELVPGDQLHKNFTSEHLVNVAKQDIPLETLMNLLTEQDPRYAWSDESGVVNVIPAHMDPGSESPIHQSIDLFVAYNLSFEEAIELIAMPWSNADYLQRVIPNVANKADLDFQDIPGFVNLGEAKKSFLRTMNFVAYKPTMRDIFNDILRAQGQGYWIAWSPPGPDAQGKKRNWVVEFYPLDSGEK